MKKMKTSLVTLLLITSTFLLIKCNHRNNISEINLSETASPDKTSTILKMQFIKKEISKYQIEKFGGDTNFQKLRKDQKKEVEFKYYVNKSYFR